MNSIELSAKLKGKPFSRQQAKDAGITFYQLQKLERTGKIEKISRGLYRFTHRTIENALTDAFRAACLRVSLPSAICLVSALVHLELVDAIPKKTWIMTNASKRSQDPSLRLLRTRNPVWSIGIEKRSGYWITSLERTLVDAIVYRRLIGTNIAMEALRKAVKTNATTLGKLIDMGNKLSVAHRIRPYIEALA